MIKTKCVLLLLLAAVAAKQDQTSSTKLVTNNDQQVSDDQVTSILVHPGPDGPRHVILSNDHQVISSSPAISSMEGVSSRTVGTNYHYTSLNYAPRSEEVEYHQTIPPPLKQVTYGPPQPVAFRRNRPPQQLYHSRFHQSGKIPHSKAPQEEAVYKYSTYVKHDKVKDTGKDVQKGYYSSHSDKPAYSITTASEPHHKPQYEGLSKYRTREEDEEMKYRESIGDIYNPDNFEKSSEYLEKKQKHLHYSKSGNKQPNYVANSVDHTPNKNYQSPYNTFDGDSYHDAPSGFDDYNGGKVVPLLAKFYKQPLPIIHTQLPADNLGLFVQYYQPQRSGYEKEEISNYYEQYPQGKLTLKRESSGSEWTPINAPDGAVPAKAYDIPAPDLSVGNPTPQKVYRRDYDDASVVVGKSKQNIATSSHRIQGNSEGVVSAVVRVKQ